jgi:type II secretory pathway pseudopilin PulG
MMDSWPLSHRCRNFAIRAFTLLECLVACVILSAMMILLLGIANGASRLWRESERRSETSREARAGLRMIAGDLRSAVITKTSPLVIRPSGETGTGERLFFLTVRPGGDALGDLCAVGYLVGQEPGGDGVLNLYRFHAPPGKVAQALERGNLGELYETASPSDGTTTELLSRHIVRLEVRDAGLSSGTSPGPSALLIGLDAIGGETARILASHPGDDARKAALLRRKLRTFSTVVRLPPVREQPAGP